jgi:ArsR family transcriptional regulator
VLKAGGLLLLVDFAPHGEESLRDEHAHRRLGFDEAEVAAWFKASGMSLLKSEHLTGDPLTVAIWLGQKNDSGNSAS